MPPPWDLPAHVTHISHACTPLAHASHTSTHTCTHSLSHTLVSPSLADSCSPVSRCLNPCAHHQLPGHYPQVMWSARNPRPPPTHPNTSPSLLLLRQLGVMNRQSLPWFLGVPISPAITALAPCLSSSLGVSPPSLPFTGTRAGGFLAPHPCSRPQSLHLHKPKH